MTTAMVYYFITIFLLSCAGLIVFGVINTCLQLIEFNINFPLRSYVFCMPEDIAFQHTIAKPMSFDVSTNGRVCALRQVLLTLPTTLPQDELSHFPPNRNTVDTKDKGSPGKFQTLNQ